MSQIITIHEIALERIRKEKEERTGRLDLNANQITKIENLDTLCRVGSLYLSSNPIALIENLDGLASLQDTDI